MNLSRNAYPTLSSEQIHNYTSRRFEEARANTYYSADNMTVTRETDQLTGDIVLTVNSQGMAYHRRITQLEILQTPEGLPVEDVLRSAE